MTAGEEQENGKMYKREMLHFDFFNAASLSFIG
jgi:hypothetical protein